MSTHEKLRGKVCRGQQLNAAVFERADYGQKKTVVLTVAAPQEEMIGEKTDRVEIWRLTPDKTGIVEAELVNLARHCRMTDAMLEEKFRGVPKFTESAVPKDVADIREARVGVVVDSETDDLVSGVLERLSQHDGKTPPARDEADTLHRREVDSFIRRRSGRHTASEQITGTVDQE